MAEIKFTKIKEFGTIHKNDKRIVVATLQESRAEENGEEKTHTYLSFHEHFMNDEGKLSPRKLNNPNAKFPEKVISFTLPYNANVINDLVTVVKAISKFFDEKPKPANKERF